MSLTRDDQAISTDAAVVAVIVTSNHSALLRECIRSVRGQVPGATLILMVDNASDPEMGSVLAEFPELLTTRLSTNAGDASGFAAGIAAALELGMDWLWLRRGGYQLNYFDYRNDFCKRFDALVGHLDMRFSIGFNIGDEGTVQEVMWDSAAFQAGLTAGALIQRGKGESYNARSISDAIEAAWHGAALRLTVNARSQSKPRDVTVDYRTGHRFPHLEPVRASALD